MPLKKGRSRKAISSNIRDLYKKFKKAGRSTKKALAMASAAALSKAGKSRKRKKKS